MKKIKILLAGLIMMSLSACNSSTSNNNVKEAVNASIPQNEQTLEMNVDTLNAKIYADIQDEIIKRRASIPTEALLVIGETHEFLKMMDEGKEKEAIDFGHKLIGQFEVLLTKNPSLSFIPVDATFKTNELVTDIETVRSIVDASKDAMDNGYYQAAAKLLGDLRSEVVIESYYLPASTYPDAIKVAVALLEDGKMDAAKLITQNVLGTIVVEETVMPLPILKAEQMIVEAAKIDAKNHDNADKVVNLLKNAHYQLLLAEEMGYGKHDKDYALLNTAIENLQKSVNAKSDSGSSFDSLKMDIKKFKERLFPKGEKENRTDLTKETKKAEK